MAASLPPRRPPANLHPIPRTWKSSGRNSTGPAVKPAWTVWLLGPKPAAGDYFGCYLTIVNFCRLGLVFGVGDEGFRYVGGGEGGGFLFFFCAAARSSSTNFNVGGSKELGLQNWARLGEVGGPCTIGIVQSGRN